MGNILGIYIAESDALAMQNIERAQVEAGKGIVGDRYYSERGTFSEKLTGLTDRELTLIESEEIEEFNEKYGFDFNYGDFRRNIVTRGIRLNQLEGKELSLGKIRLRGIRLCEPCAHLAKLLTPKILPALGPVHTNSIAPVASENPPIKARREKFCHSK